jgi:hypothetical protein
LGLDGWLREVEGDTTMVTSRTKMKQIEEDEVEYLRESTTIASDSPEEINKGLVRLSADLAYWNKQYAEAIRAQLRAKATEKQVRASVYKEIRRSSETKLSEAALAAEIETHEDVRAAVDRLIDAEADKARIYGVVDSVRSKKEDLISLGAQYRAELGGDPLLKREARDRRTLGEEDDAD